MVPPARWKKEFDAIGINQLLVLTNMENYNAILIDKRKDIQMEEKQILVTADNIQNLVYTVRGQQVMLDSDLAEIYGYTVRTLNQQVNRNIERFPEDFMFQLTQEEWDILKSQIVTSSWGGKRKLPYVFTEQGVYMLTTVLKKDLAVQQSIAIMRAFKEMRHYIQKNPQLATTTELNAISEHLSYLKGHVSSFEERVDKQILDIKKDINKLNENFINKEDLKEFIIFKGQKFEPDILYTDIYIKAQKNIMIVDDYISDKTLQLLSQKQENVAVTLFTRNACNVQQRLTASLVNDFNEEYPTLCLKPNKEWHDRCIFIDYGTENEQVYQCGTSSKDAGTKICSIIKIEKTEIYHSVMNKMLKQEDLSL